MIDNAGNIVEEGDVSVFKREYYWLDCKHCLGYGRVPRSVKLGLTIVATIECPECGGSGGQWIEEKIMTKEVSDD